MTVVESLYGQKIYLYGDTITVALDNSGVLNSKFTLIAATINTVPSIDYTIKPLFPKPLVTGTENNISYSVKLNPNTNLEAPALNVQYYLSKDTLYSKDDIYIKDYNIYGYSEYSLSINDMALIDVSIPKGKYNLLIVIDPKKLIVESNEKNNVVVIPTTVE
jgi:subtilase family serine protease